VRCVEKLLVACGNTWVLVVAKLPQIGRFFSLASKNLMGTTVDVAFVVAFTV
jgi:hypothetical protein